MKLSLKNIGRINTASIEINGITVIAGENNTGKSTVSRVLFAVFNSFYNIKKQIEVERIQNIENLIDVLYHSITAQSRKFDTKKAAQEIVSCCDLVKDDQRTIEFTIYGTLLRYNDNVGITHKEIVETVNDFIARIKDALAVPNTDIVKLVLEKKLDAEFNGQINNIFVDKSGEISFSIKDTNMVITIADNSVKSVEGEMDLRTEAVYIDDPFVLDEVFYSYSYASENKYLDHRGHLGKKLAKENNSNLIEEIVASKKLENIYNKISKVCSGDIVKNKRSGLGYRRKGGDRILDVKNLSSGFKTFAILKTLLLNSTIEYNGTIILDEPEIHLHPEWQLLFAELIVLIQKEFGVHILLNTHSPYFLNAIEVYSAKYGVADKCKYYLASSENDISNIEDVSNYIEKIYSKLARPLQDLENERGQL